MQNFYQGSIRIKDFMAFLKTIFADHGWKIAKENLTTSQWFVVQKKANNESVMTFGFRDIYYPNFGNIHIWPAMAINDTVDVNGIFTSAFNPTTNILYRCRTEVHNTNSVDISIVPDYHTNAHAWLNYYNSAMTDADADPRYVFYILSFNKDNFWIKTRGNPQTGGDRRTSVLGGAFEKTVDNYNTSDTRGNWGYICRVDDNPEARCEVSRGGHIGEATGTNSIWFDFGTQSLLTFLTPIGRSDNNPIYGKPLAYPMFVNNDSHPQYFLTMFPKTFALASENNSTFYDETFYTNFGTSKYIYDRNRYFWVIDSPTDLKVIEDNSGAYQLSWKNPNFSSLAKVEIYAKIGAYPSSPSDTGATKIYTDNNPVKDATAVYTDNEVSRQGKDVYYAAFAFDGNPTVPQVSLLNDSCCARANVTIETFVSPATEANPTIYRGSSSDESNLNIYYPPIVHFACEDQGDTDVVINSAGTLNGKLMPAGTTANIVKTASGKFGNGFTLSNGRYIVIPANSAMRFSGNYTMRMWAKLTSTSTGVANFFGTLADECGIRYGWAANPVYFSFFIQSNEWRTPTTYTIDMNAMHLYTFIRRGCRLEIYQDNTQIANYNVNSYSVMWNPNSADFSIGCRRNDKIEFLNAIIDDIGIFNYAISPAQIQFDYTNASNLVTIISALGKDCYSVLANANGSLNDTLVYNLPLVVNVSGKAAILFSMFATRTGSNIKIWLGYNGTQLANITPEIVTSNTWQSVVLDISSIPNEQRAFINQIGFTVLNADADNIFAIKNVRADNPI